MNFMNNKTGRLIFIYSAAAVLAASVIRFFQYVSIMDFDTGFFILGSEKIGALIYAVLLAAAVGFGITAFIGNKKKWTAFTVSSSGMGEKATIPIGIVYLLAAAVKAYEGFTLENAGVLKTVIVYLFAAALAASGFLFLKNSVPPAASGLLHLLYGAGFFYEAIVLFTDDLVIKNRSDNLLLLFILVIGTLFFPSAARFYGRLESKGSRIREILTGGFLFIVSGAYVVSKLMAYAFGGGAAEGMDPISCDAVTAALLSGIFLFSVSTARQTAEIDYISDDDDEKDNEK